LKKEGENYVNVAKESGTWPKTTGTKEEERRG